MNEIIQGLLPYIKGFIGIYLVGNIVAWVLGIVFFIAFTIIMFKKQIEENELDLQCLESELISTYDRKIYRLEELRRKVKSFKKINKITNRINQLELKRDEFKN